MRVIKFKEGKECITEWAQDKAVNINLGYCPVKNQYMFYYSDKSKFITIETNLEKLRIKK